MTPAMTECGRSAGGARRSPEQWRVLVEAFSRSGATRKQFCARHGVALSTFGWWQRRLQEESATPAAVATGAARSLFVELAAAPQPAPLARPLPAWDVELELGAGVYLRLRRAPC